VIARVRFLIDARVADAIGTTRRRRAMVGERRPDRVITRSARTGRPIGAPRSRDRRAAIA
jgi:hypothetical protein